MKTIIVGGGKASSRWRSSFCVSTLLLSLDGFDFTTNLAAEIACFNNIGLGIGLVGPMGNFRRILHIPKCCCL